MDTDGEEHRGNDADYFTTDEREWGKRLRFLIVSKLSRNLCGSSTHIATCPNPCESVFIRGNVSLLFFLNETRR